MYLLTIFTLNFQASASYAMTCGDLLRHQSQINVSLDIFKSSLSLLKDKEKKVEEIKKNSQESIEDTLKVTPGFVHAKEFKIHLGNKKSLTFTPSRLTGYEAFFSYDEESVYIGDKWFKAPKEHYRAMLQHEYGHYLFLVNFAKHSLHWDVRYNGYHETLLKKYDLTKEKVDVITGRQEVISKPYQELFSDLLSVMTDQRPNQFKGLLSFLAKEESEGKSLVLLSEKEIQSRTFENEILLSRWTHKYENEHDVMEPSRAYLWKKWKALSPSLSEADFVKLVFKVLSQEIVERSEAIELVNISSEEINLRFIRRLEEAFQ